MSASIGDIIARQAEEVANIRAALEGHRSPFRIRGTNWWAASPNCLALRTPTGDTVACRDDVEDLDDWERGRYDDNGNEYVEHYDVALDQIRSAQDALDWICRISAKRFRVQDRAGFVTALMYVSRFCGGGIANAMQAAASIERGPCVYMVQESGVERRVKIGSSDWSVLRNRIDALQTGNPNELVLIATFKGGRDLERALHKRFAAHRLRGEWFAAHEELLAYAARGYRPLGANR